MFICQIRLLDRSCYHIWLCFLDDKGISSPHSWGRKGYSSVIESPLPSAPGLLMIRMVWELQTSGSLHGGMLSNDLDEKQVTLLTKRYQFLTYAVQSLSRTRLNHVRLIVTPWATAHHAARSLTISWSLLKFMLVE